jgi:hypothetical protein
VWAFAQPDKKLFDPLKEFEKLHGSDLTCDYPSSVALRNQLTHMITASRKDIFSAFARGGAKRLKSDNEQPQHQDGTGAGTGDIHSQPPGTTAGDSGHDATVIGRVGESP